MTSRGAGAFHSLWRDHTRTAVFYYKKINNSVRPSVLVCCHLDRRIWLASCIVPLVLYCRWTESGRVLLCCLGRFVSGTRCSPYFMLWCWILYFAGWRRGPAVRPYVESLYLAGIETVFPRTPMCPLSYRPAATLRMYWRCLNGTKRSLPETSTLTTIPAFC